MNFSNIKYYPDRFYIRLDGFNLDNLRTLLTETLINKEHAVFIHEYYHYLTNITTLPGIRQFNLNFCDRFRAITILTEKESLNAYPINKNTYSSCGSMVKYWDDVLKIIDEDDIDYELSEEAENAINKKFNIESINRTRKPMDVVIGDTTYEGERIFITINTIGLVNRQSFNLTFGAIDEFLSSAIDEYLYENDLSDIDPSLLNSRPFYPYRFFDELLSYYNINRVSAFEKILLAYYALNSSRPPITLIEILEKIKEDGYENFQSYPEHYLLSHLSTCTEYDEMLQYTKKFAKETGAQDRVHISQALTYFYDKFYIAKKLKEDDFFYFVRPFFINETDNFKFKQKFLQALSRIVNVFSPPVILKDRQFYYIDKLTSFGESTMLILATYEILESLKKNKIASRPDSQKRRYSFPDGDPNCDNPKKFTPLPTNIIFRIALNELNLYKLYLENSSDI
ncbi:hypothetical protein [Chryseobacterium sp.]|uniref:hypothetical protein n=1 Tax=Chryseobacterium sp. TaxID=1871047 RepID=UPI0031DD542D